MSVMSVLVDTDATASCESTLYIVALLIHANVLCYFVRRANQELHYVLHGRTNLQIRIEMMAAF